MNWNKIWARISEAAEDDYYSLTDEERVIFNLKNVIDAVSGKGLMSFYENKNGDYAEDAAEDLYTAGLDEAASIIESANAIFPGGCPPSENDCRIEIIDSWDHEFDELFDQWTDDILEFSQLLDETFENLISQLND